MKRNEILSIAIIAIIAVISIFFMNLSTDADQKNVMITINNKLYKNISFDNDTNETYTIETDYGTNILFIENGTVNITEADCPNQVCVHTKAASDIGDMIVCLPHKLVVQITEQGR